MFLLRALVVWLVIIAVETVHGILRTLLLVPMMGDFPARQISVFTCSLLIFGVTLLFINWIAARTTLQLLMVGTIWVLLTILFEITLGRLVLDLSWDRITEDYDITKSGLKVVKKHRWLRKGISWPGINMMARNDKMEHLDS